MADEADLSVVLDSDMGVRRTRLTLESLGPRASAASWFNYGPWPEHEFRRLTRAIDGHRAEGPMQRPTTSLWSCGWTPSPTTSRATRP